MRQMTRQLARELLAFNRTLAWRCFIHERDAVSVDAVDSFDARWAKTIADMPTLRAAAAVLAKKESIPTFLAVDGEVLNPEPYQAGTQPAHLSSFEWNREMYRYLADRNRHP